VLKDGVLQQCDAPSTLYHAPLNLFVAGFIGSPAMNMIEVGDARPATLGEATLELSEEAQAAFKAGGRATVGFRPEAMTIGDGPLKARVRTAEDLGSEVFVHVAIDHMGNALPLTARMAPPFDGNPGDEVGVQLTGTVHLFGADGLRVASGPATLR
jgi:multiple sugar transport system ATP-binding protein